MIVSLFFVLPESLKYKVKQVRECVIFSGDCVKNKINYVSQETNNKKEAELKELCV